MNTLKLRDEEILELIEALVMIEIIEIDKKMPYIPEDWQRRTKLYIKLLEAHSSGQSDE